MSGGEDHSPTRAVCFDLDDTLYDYRAYARSGLAAAADRLEATTGEQYHDELAAIYFEEGLTEGTFDHLLEREALPAEYAGDLVAAFHDASTDLSPYPETERVLEALRASYRLGLVTDGRGGRAKLDRLGLAGYFEHVVVAPAIDASKREVEPFERVLSGLGVAPEATVFVGDDPRFDCRVPNALGMTTVRVRRGRHADLEPAAAAAPDHEIDRLDALLDLL